ncbi:SprT family protein [Paenibacillus thiaminolyticus]|uniref:Protein SprT-like n=1 Tax=Paenibacillus thiaminolyticus TaxID=49283 RepID=A0A3A3GCL4_PANTH|nr:SprT family protein [Paenibacillus thiaminolyticus]RJG19066.1 SprT family protein [Paenibacillus thiaminolyticus]
MTYTNQSLQQWVETVSLRDFGKPFRHQARYNGRLKSTGGRYLLASHHIEINPKQLEAFGEEEVERIIKHELCHYHLHLEGRGYRHRDREFKELLQAVGGSRYCRSLPGAEGKRRLPYRYRLECVECRHTYLRKRRVDVTKYVCGRCRGKLRLVPVRTETGRKDNG